MNQHRIVGKERRYHPLLINKKQPHHRRYLPEYTRIETEAGGKNRGWMAGMVFRIINEAQNYNTRMNKHGRERQ